MSSQFFGIGVEGRLTVAHGRDLQAFGGDDEATQVYPFRLSVSNVIWRLDTARPRSDGFAHLLIGTDGNDLYTLTFRHDSGRLGITPEFGKNARGFVFPGSIPQLVDDSRTFWIAFINSSALRNSQGTPVPWPDDPSLQDEYFDSRRPATNDYQITMERMSSWPHLPATIQYRLNDGTLVGLYRVIATTNRFGYELPSEFEVKHFGKRGFVRYANRGKIDAVRPLSLTNFLPEPVNGMQVSDYRFRDQGPGISNVKYSVSENRWLSSKSPELGALLETERQKRLGALYGPEAGFARKIVVWILLICVTAPLVWLAKKRNRGLKNEPEK